MTKNRSKCLFILFAILLVICLIATFVNFTYPLSVKGNYYSYSNFVSNLKLGEDISEGLRLTYRADLPEYESESNYESLLNATVSDLKDIVQSQGYKDVVVTTTDNNQIIVNVGNIVTSEDKNEIISLIGEMSAINFSMNSDGSEPFATAKDIASIETLSKVENITYYYVRISFTKQSQAAINEATSEGGTLYMLLGDTTVGSMQIESNTLSGGYLEIFSQDFVDELSANTYANRLRTGTFALELTQLKSATISPSYGIGVGIFLSVAATLIVIAIIAYLIYKYNHLGLIASFALMFFICISLFLLQSVPAVHINFAGFIGLLVAMLLVVDTMVGMFEKAKEHYKSDIKLYISLKMAQKETLVKTIILNLVFMVTGFVCMFMPTLPVQSFGWVVFVMSFVSAFTSLVLMRLFVKMYLPFNNSNGNKCNFHKGGNNA